MYDRINIDKNKIKNELTPKSWRDKNQANKIISHHPHRFCESKAVVPPILLEGLGGQFSLGNWQVVWFNTTAKTNTKASAINKLKNIIENLRR